MYGENHSDYYQYIIAQVDITIITRNELRQKMTHNRQINVLCLECPILGEEGEEARASFLNLFYLGPIHQRCMIYPLPPPPRLHNALVSNKA